MVISKFNLNPLDKPSTTKERAYNEIKHVILSGYISSDEIFTEVKLAEVLQTSRTPVREALQDLIKEGLIVSIPRKGMTVRKVSENEMEQIFLLRTTIENKVIQKLAEIITPDQLTALKDICKQQEEAMLANDDIAFIQLDQDFHLALTKLVGYELIEQVLLNLHNLSQLIGLRAIKKSNRMKEVLEEHLNIIDAMERKGSDPSVQAMTRHLNRTKDSLVEE